MEQLGVRGLVTQLAEDIGWLEDHCRRQPSQGPQAGQLRLAAALVRNQIGPFLDGQPTTPLHIAIVGGAGAGKSTISNMLSGAAAAEANPQAGFTRHPIAYASANAGSNWTGHLGFLGPLRRLPQPAPSNLDEDVYQIRSVPSAEGVHSILDSFVVWDCPDMTTWAATGYVPRLFEVAGLADIIVYVASDERYNDEVPTQFLHLLLQAGKPVVCVLTKMREADAAAFVEHFRKDVLARIHAGAVVCLAVPFLPPAQTADPARLAGKYRIPLLNQVRVLGDPPDNARRRGVRWATTYLVGAQEKLMSVAKSDVTALQEWRAVVQAGRAEFDDRYRREYLAGEKFRRFDEALVRLLDLLELPGGVGRVVSNVLWGLRTPYRLLMGMASKALSRPQSAVIPEQPVLEAAFAGWVDLLRKEAATRGRTHGLWAHIEKGFGSGLAEGARERFQQGLRAFQTGQTEEVDRTARAIYEELEKNPVSLNIIRSGKFGLDIMAIGAAVAMAGHTYALDLVLVPLASSVTHHLVELLGKQYVDSQREMARARQQALVSQHLSGPLAEWLANWPATGGSEYERLQQALRRIPSSIRQLEAEVTKKLTT